VSALSALIFLIMVINFHNNNMQAKESHNQIKTLLIKGI